jgi:methenyltetrahydrofolate cyclohydrolase
LINRAGLKDCSDRKDIDIFFIFGIIGKQYSTDFNMYRKNFEAFLRDLSSSRPVPGGGSVAALGAACGIGLLIMVGKLSFDKDQEKGKSIRKSLNLLKSSLRRLQEFIDEDALSYNRVIKAYKLPGNTAANKQKRCRSIQKSLKAAVKISFLISEESYKAVRLAPIIALESKKSLLPDVEIGVSFLDIAFNSSVLNFKQNLKQLKPEARSKGLNKKISQFQKDIKRLKDRAYCNIAKVQKNK